MFDGVTVLPGDKDVIQITASEDPCVANDEVAFELVSCRMTSHYDNKYHYSVKTFHLRHSTLSV